MQFKKRMLSALCLLLVLVLLLPATLPVKAAQPTGYVIWSVEMFTIGCGYLVYPVQVPVYEGETAADQLIRLLHDSGYVGYYGGTTKSAFYLGYIADGSASGAKYNLYQKSGTPTRPKQLNLSPSIPSNLAARLQQTMLYFDPEDYGKNWTGYLGEFAFTNGSGWMFSVNNHFPSVGFADTYLSDGDVVRVQFTLGYGADIGGLGPVGGSIPGAGANQPTSEYYPVANKDALTKAICAALSSGLLEKETVQTAYSAALRAAKTLDASQSSVDSAVMELRSSLENPTSAVTQPTVTATEAPPQTEPSQESTPSPTEEAPAAPTQSDTTAPSAPTESTGHTESTQTGATEAPTIAVDTTEEADLAKLPEESVSSNAADDSTVAPEGGTADAAKPEEKGSITPAILAAVSAAAAVGYFFWKRKGRKDSNG